MTRSRWSYILAALVAAFALSASAQPPALERYIVVLDRNAGPPESVAAELALRTSGRVGYVYSHALQGFSIALPPQALPALENENAIGLAARAERAGNR